MRSSVLGPVLLLFLVSLLPSQGRAQSTSSTQADRLLRDIRVTCGAAQTSAIQNCASAYFGAAATAFGTKNPYIGVLAIVGARFMCSAAFTSANADCDRAIQAMNDYQESRRDEAAKKQAAAADSAADREAKRQKEIEERDKRESDRIKEFRNTENLEKFISEAAADGIKNDAVINDRIRGTVRCVQDESGGSSGVCAQCQAGAVSGVPCPVMNVRPGARAYSGFLTKRGVELMSVRRDSAALGGIVAEDSVVFSRFMGKVVVVARCTVSTSLCNMTEISALSGSVNLTSIGQLNLEGAQRFLGFEYMKGGVGAGFSPTAVSTGILRY